MLTDCNGKPATLGIGDGICFYTEQQFVVMVQKFGTGSRFYWPENDDKRKFPFLKDEKDFRHFAQAIADLLGFALKQELPTPYGPSYSFVPRPQ